MRSIRLASGLLGAMTLLPAAASAAGPLQRYALVLGANFGGADRPRLRYAVTDAERFARVLADLGGVLPGNEIVLREPKLRDLTDALDALTRRLTEARRAPAAAGGRTEVLLYYSGHADEKGLLLGDDRYSYRTLRDRLDQIPADVRIAVLDACASGAFTRIKGGRARPPFLVDASAEMRGHAFLTSSAANEAAQESDRIRASYFTHFLVSGFRGAADTSGDGRVTLNEAYQFAFHETLGRTLDTKGGAQHPSYDISLSGTGDVVMTDVRQTTATLVLPEELEGRVFIRTPAQELVVELYKPAGRPVELGLEPGTYDVRVERAKGSVAGKAVVPDGARVSLDLRQLGPTALEPTRRRGDKPARHLAVARRTRIELRTGTWGSSYEDGRDGPRFVVRDGPHEFFGGVQFTRYLREDLAVTLGIDAHMRTSSQYSATLWRLGDVGVDGLAVPVGIRWNPLKGEHQQQVKPFIGAAVGPVIAALNKVTFASPSETQVFPETHPATIGGRIGGGFDIHLARSFSVGIGADYNALKRVSRSLALGFEQRTTFAGPQVTVAAGWLFGSGNAANSTP
jgi:hypothetical protein